MHINIVVFLVAPVSGLDTVERVRQIKFFFFNFFFVHFSLSALSSSHFCVVGCERRHCKRYYAPAHTHTQIIIISRVQSLINNFNKIMYVPAAVQSRILFAMLFHSSQQHHSHQSYTRCSVWVCVCAVGAFSWKWRKKKEMRILWWPLPFRAAHNIQYIYILVSMQAQKKKTVVDGTITKNRM